VNIGLLVTFLACGALGVSIVSYFLAARGNLRYLGLGRISYKYFTAFVVLACLLLFYFFLSRDYSYRYVYDYSSSDLSLLYVISAFWAGQQGTYLLWLLLSAILGFYIIKRGRDFTAWGMFFYGLINVFFCVMLVAISPFEKLPIPQPDGAGLNPLLKDPWMVIHPPVIFLGYAAVAVPAVIALAALIKNKFDDWLTVSFAPAALGAVALAAGNIMGGFWAYKTLGWGGYWAWDPVENSSFIPWMTSLALMHGMLVERKNGALRKTNLFLAVFTFLLVVYGTFLTRSGVLADFSVHSFVDLGVNVYLIGFMLGIALLSLIVFFARARRITGPSLNLAATSQEFALMVSVWLLMLIALVVLSGTSWPLITTWMGSPGTVDTGVYTRVSMPLAIVIGLFLGFAPFMLGTGGRAADLVKKVIPSAAASLAVTVIAFAVGVKAVTHLLFIFFASLAFFSNVLALTRYLPRRLAYAGAQVTHFGFALMLIGILGSSAYAINQKTVIDRDGTKTVYGIDISYRGMKGDIESPDNEIILSIKDDGNQYEARPKLYWAKRMESLMKKPHIQRYLFYDLYLAPEQIQPSSEIPGVKLVRGQPSNLGGFTVTFTGFDQGSHGHGGPMRFGAILQVTDSAGRSGTIIPSIQFGTDGKMIYNDTTLAAGLDSRPVRLEKILADEGAVYISVAGLTPQVPVDRLILEVSEKPTMNILWAGCIIVVTGGLLALRKRWLMSKPAITG
jgi:cytochrome c-type biogenesis protein CcmF